MIPGYTKNPKIYTPIAIYSRCLYLTRLNVGHHVKQTEDQEQLNVGRTFLRIENAPGIGNI